VLTARARDAAGNTTTSASVTVTVSNAAPTGLVLALGFNETSGTTATDSSGANNPGTITGATRTASGKYGGALSFDGVNDLVTIADAASLDLTTGMTLEAWVNPTTINGWETVFLKESTGELAYALYADNNGNDSGGPRRPGGWVRQGSTSYSTLGTAQLPLNTWTHLATTYDGAMLRLYVNGTQVSSLARSGAINVSANPLRIGGNNIWSEWFNGLIDEVRVYNRALSLSEIQTDMNTPLEGADTAPPTASLISPTEGATVSGTINATANASDNIGVAGVQFLLDGVNLGAEDTSAPYSLSWNTIGTANGNHFLTARARDAAGNTTTSTPVAVTVNNDTSAPTVNLTAPVAGATVSGTDTISAVASDNVGIVGVQFLLDDVALGTEDTAAPFELSWDTTATANGIHVLKARARDAAGNLTTSAGVSVTVNNVDTTLPSVALTAPANGATVAGTITVSANANDNVGIAGVQFLLDDVALGAEDTVAPYSVSWNTIAASNGAHVLKAVARDLAGNTTTSTAVAVTVNNDLTSPAVAVTAPSAGATVSGTIAVSANASDNVGVAGVQFLLNGVNLGTEDTSSPYSVSWNTAAATNGSHVLTARARDAAGNTTTSASVTVTVSNAAPTGLVLALGFNETSGTTATDSSGANNPGTITGATRTVSGKYGGALNFDGINDLVTVADAASLDLTNGMTLEAWVNPTTINGWETVILKETTGDLVYALYADNNGNDTGGPRRPAAWIRQGSTQYSTAGTSQVATNTWTHLAATYNATNLRLFVNGVQVSSIARTGNLGVSGNPLRIGGNNIWSEWFNGLIDEVRVYNRALSAAEIQNDMNTPIGGGALLAHSTNGASGNSPPLTPAVLSEYQTEAIARWGAGGISPDELARLHRVEVRVTDLAENQLGFVDGESVWIDDDAAGNGWFVDLTPAEDSEFPALPGSAAYGRMDLLTVVAHELGHTLGLDHDDDTASLMAASLPAGVRRLPKVSSSLLTAGDRVTSAAVTAGAIEPPYFEARESLSANFTVRGHAVQNANPRPDLNRPLAGEGTLSLLSMLRNDDLSSQSTDRRLYSGGPMQLGSILDEIFASSTLFTRHRRNCRGLSLHFGG
jgi:hypothetical protein